MTDISGAMGPCPMCGTSRPVLVCKKCASRNLNHSHVNGHYFWRCLACGLSADKREDIARAFIASHPQRDGEGNRGGEPQVSAPLPPKIELPNGLKIQLGGMFKLVYQEELFELAGPVKGYSGPERRAAQLIREAWNKLPDTPTLADPAPPGTDANQQSKTGGAQASDSLD